MSVGSQVVERNLPLTLEELYRGAQVQYAICLHPRYAVSGTSLLYRATNPHHFHCLVYVFTVRCLVLTSRIHIVAVSIPLRTHCMVLRSTLSAYVFALQCPVLTQRLVLPPMLSSYALTTRCLVLTKRMLLGPSYHKRLRLRPGATPRPLSSALRARHLTRNTQHLTLSPEAQPELISQPSTLNPQASTRKPQPSTLKPHP